MNPVIENILTRRSIRSFKDQKITSDELMTILTAGSYAPSGMGMQSWKFTAIQDTHVMEEVNETMRQTLLAIDKEEEAYSYFAPYIHKANDVTTNFIYHAPTYILVSNLTDNKNAMADSSLALGNMMLAAHSLGIGTCWLNQLPRLSNYPIMREFLSKLGIPRDHSIFGSIVLGYPAVETKAAAPRKEVIHII